MTNHPPEPLNDRRVAQAHAEVGQTAISRPVALALTGVLIIATATVPLAQLWLAPEVWRVGPGSAVAGAVSSHADGRAQHGGTLMAPFVAQIVEPVVAQNRRLLRAIDTFTDQLDNDSLLARHLRPVVQLLATRLTGAGNDRVYLGRDGWLFYANDVHHVVGPGFLDDAQIARRAAAGNSLAAAPAPDPRPALLAFRDALADRDITLVLMPTPVKPAIHPDQLARSAVAAPLRNLSFDQFRDEMVAAGILFFDPATVLAATRSGSPAYLRGDTHWRPDAVEAVARALADFLERETLLPRRDLLAASTRDFNVSNQGDTLGLLGLPVWWSAATPETVTIRQVRAPGGEPWQPSRSADLLLLGDSFSNIYSLASMGWGTGAGLAEQLSVALRRPIDRLTQNDNGAFASRVALALELARAPDRLAATRVVVYQFATRELSQGDWRVVDIAPPSPGLSPAAPEVPGATVAILRPAPGRALTVRGRVRQRAPAPRPGTVPYRDHIIAVELVDLQGDDPAIDGSGALVYLSSMEDNVWTPAATLAVDAIVTLSLRPWAEVAPERDGVTRAELVQGDLVFAQPWWGELITP